MAFRPTPDPEVVPLLRALKSRIEGLGTTVTVSSRDGIDVYTRGKTAFLHLELKRDHMNLDLWLSGEQLDEARSSGIARAHPFLGDEAVRVRFERAEDLSRVARWLEASFEYTPDRAKKHRASPERVVEKTVPLIKVQPATPAPAAARPPAALARPSAEPEPKAKPAAKAKRPPAKAARAPKARPAKARKTTRKKPAKKAARKKR